MQPRGYTDSIIPMGMQKTSLMESHEVYRHVHSQLTQIKIAADAAGMLLRMPVNHPMQRKQCIVYDPHLLFAYELRMNMAENFQTPAQKTRGSLVLLEAFNIQKSFADRLVLDVKTFRVYAGDKIGFVGANGSGKTTLLNILSGQAEPDTGTLRRYCDIAYIRQFGGEYIETVSTPGSIESNEMYRPLENNHAKKLREYGVGDKTGNPTVSGGETARLKIAGALSEERRLLFADEPTSNLDMEGIARFGEELAKQESFILISHDRDLLNRYCNRIIALENRDLAVYEGGFDAYRQQVDSKRERAQVEYEQYSAEKDRLQKVYTEKKAKAAKVAKKPKGMSSSEMKQRDFIATSRSNDGKQRSFERAANAVQARIDHMEVKEKPSEMPRIKLDFALTEPPANKIVITGEGITFAYDHRVIFDKAKFNIKNGARVAVTGPNGSGKTTLLNLIYQGDAAVYAVPKARIGYFYQGFEQIDFKRSVLQNVMTDSVQREAVVRSVLARLLFNRDDIHKPAEVLSGGERIKLSLAKLLVSKNNILILDEPTNYLDMPSIEILQAMLCEYEGTLLFVSHDRAFVNAVCTELLMIKDKQLHSFEGNLEAYEQRASAGYTDPQKLILEHKLAALSAEIAHASGAQKDELEAQYLTLLRESKQ